MNVCSQVGCPELVEQPGRCPDCRRRADRARGTPKQRGYTTPGHRKKFRPAVLARHPICVVCRSAPSTVADHYPLSRRELVAADLDPNDPAHGRGLCKPCHDRHTAQAQPGGWHTHGQ